MCLAGVDNLLKVKCEHSNIILSKVATGDNSASTGIGEEGRDEGGRIGHRLDFAVYKG